MPKVFIVQEPMKRDPVSDQLVPSADFTPALRFGDIKFCLRHGAVAFATQPTIEKLREVFKDFTDEDYFIAAGDPSAIVLASVVLTQMRNGRFKMLKWDRRERSYIEIQVSTKQGVL